ncbi:sugar ABC transporter permease [Paenibacillus sp. TRM 82003]|nr:sugar ABC transporter permease [Paenibacillus sp. TRM 82003]
MKTLRWEKRKELLIGYAFLWPTVTLFAVFLFYPLIRSVYLSLFATDVRGEAVRFIGFQHYERLISSGDFVNSLRTTALFTVYTVPASIVIALGLALLTYNKLRGMKGYQFMFTLPLAMSVGTSSVIWTLLFHPTSGPINYALSGIGVKPIFWLNDPSWALPAVSAATIWMDLGFLFIVLLAGLQGIPEDLYESARIDGAGGMRILRSITLPLLSPTLFFVGIISLIGALQTFGQINIMTKGGPMKSTNVFVYDLYSEAFVSFQYGAACARAVLLFLMILLLTWIQFKLGERKVHYQ